MQVACLSLLCFHEFESWRLFYNLITSQNPRTMSSIGELAAQLDTAVSASDQGTVADQNLLSLIHQMNSLLSTPEGCAEFSDLVLDMSDSLLEAAGLSKACESAVAELVEAAAGKCVAREIYTALAAALSSSMQ